jgi:hypothetical protein
VPNRAIEIQLFPVWSQLGGLTHGLLLAYAAVTGGVLSFGSARGTRASCALRPCRHSMVSSHSFETLLIAFLLLLAGNLFKGF